VDHMVSRQLVDSLSDFAGSHKSVGHRYLSTLSVKQWHEVLRWLDDAGLTLTFWRCLKDVGEERLAPPEIQARLDENLEDHRSRIAQMLREFDLINSTLGAAKVPYAVLKGFALIPEYCPDILLRTAYDYDYLLAHDSLSRVDEALRAAGFVRKHRAERHPIVFFHKDRAPQAPLSRDELYRKAFPRTIELHYRFWDINAGKIQLALPQDQLSRRELRCLAGSDGAGPTLNYYALSREDELIFQVLHVFRHILRNWCRLSALLEVAYFLGHQSSDSALWDCFIDRLQCSSMLPEIAGVVFLLASKLFRTTLPPPVSLNIVGKLRRELVLWVDRYGQHSALKNFSDNKFTLFLHREFVPDEASWREVRRKALVSIQRPNRVLRPADSAVLSRVTASGKQACYVAQRLKYHMWTAIEYILEAPRWNRARSEGG
jgi:Uncharacterised nucleotidyltransferase